MKKLLLLAMTGAVMLSVGAAETPKNNANAGKNDPPKAEVKQNRTKVEQPKAKVEQPKAQDKAPAPAPEQVKASDKAEVPPAPAPAPAPAPKKKRFHIKHAGLIAVGLSALSFVLLLTLTVVTFISRKELRILAQRVKTGTDTSSKLEKSFDSKLKEAMGSTVQEVQEKNPVLRDYNTLNQQNAELEKNLKTRDAELAGSRKECDQLKNEVSRLQGDLNGVRTDLAGLQKQFDDRGAELDDALKREADLKSAYEGIIELIGKQVVEFWHGDKEENQPRERFVIMGLAKMNALHDARVEARSLLLEFQSFDQQLHATIADQEDLQRTRETIKPFICKLLDNQYRISWPQVGTNIADYSSDDLDPEGAAGGTTIKAVKCATINFVNSEGVPFQKARIVCE